MSRQRIRTSVLESSTEKCPHCGGTGHVRSVSSVALQLLRAHRGDAAQGRDAQSHRAHRAPRSRSMCSTTSARICACWKSASSITITVNADADARPASPPSPSIRGEQVMSTRSGQGHRRATDRGRCHHRPMKTVSCEDDGRRARRDSRPRAKRLKPAKRSEAIDEELAAGGPRRT